MLKYTVKRLAQSLVTILLIATIVFLLMRCLPTDYYFTTEAPFWMRRDVPKSRWSRSL